MQMHQSLPDPILNLHLLSSQYYQNTFMLLTFPYIEKNFLGLFVTSLDCSVKTPHSTKVLTDVYLFELITV